MKTANSFLLSTLIFLFAFLASSFNALAAEEKKSIQSELKPFYVEYVVGNNLINAGIAKLSLKMQADKQWVYSLKTEPSGVFRLSGKGHIHEVSIITQSQNKLIPESYSYSQAGTKRRDVNAQFNWDSRELTIQRKGEEEVETLADPILDRLSVTLAVMEQIRKGFQHAQIRVLDNGSIKTMSFTNEGEHTLKTKLGTFKTIKVRRTREGSTRSTMTWFAPELNYIPVQIEQLKKNKLVARMKINKFREIVEK